MGKNIKVMPQPICPLSPGKGGIPYGKKTQAFRLKTLRINRNKI